MEEEQTTITQNAPVELTRESAIQTAIGISASHNGQYILTIGLVKGIAETIKALEAGKVKVIFYAEDCDNDKYKDTLLAIASQYKVPVVEVPEWVQLKDYCKLGLDSETITRIAEEKGKEAKIKPRCSSCAIIDWGIESDAKAFIEKNLLA